MAAFSLARVERVAQRVAHEGQQQQREHQHAKVDSDDPPGVDVVLALRSSSPSDGVPGGTPRPRKSSEVSARMAALMRNGRKVTTGVRLLGRTWRHDDLPVAHRPARARPARSRGRGCAGTRRARSPTGPSSRTGSAAPAAAPRWARRRREDDQQVQLGHRPQISMKRCNARSVLPPKKPCTAPASTPSSTPVTGQRQANSTLTESRRSAAPAGRGPGHRCPASCPRGRRRIGRWAK
jgi:hypothetical protein